MKMLSSLFAKKGKKERAYTESILEACALFKDAVKSDSEWWQDRMLKIVEGCKDRGVEWQMSIGRDGLPVSTSGYPDTPPSPVDNLAVALLNEEWWERIKPAHDAYTVRKQQALRSLGEVAP